jgi:hypothetical protein
MAQDKTQREGRFQDFSKGEGIYKGYQDSVKEDPFDKKFLKRTFKEYDVLKKGKLHKNLQPLRDMNDQQLESLAAKAVIERSDYKPKKLNRRLNDKKYNIKWAKKVMARKQAGQTVRKQALKRTKAARAHILRVRRNRRVMKTPLYPHLPKGY